MLGRYNYTKTEIATIISSLTILIDKREKACGLITKYFDAKKINYVSKSLAYADYSFFVPKNEKLGILRDVYFDKRICIEKKNGLMELIGNLCDDGGSRIESEFIRSMGAKIYLMIEGSSFDSVIAGNYEISPGNKSKYLPQALLARIKTFEAKYNINVSFCSANSSGSFIFHTFKYHLLNDLKRGIYFGPEPLSLSEMPPTNKQTNPPSV